MSTTELKYTTFETKQLARLIRLIVVKQWFHSIFALLNTNRPDGLGMGDDINYQAANDIQRIAWNRYTALGEEIRTLTKDTYMSQFCF
jgi:hypothetical protein